MPARRFPKALVDLYNKFNESPDPPAWAGANCDALYRIFHTMDTWKECGDGDTYRDALAWAHHDITNVTDPSHEVQQCIELFLVWLKSR